MLTSWVSLQQENARGSKKAMKIVNIEEKSYHIFRTTWEISIKCSGKMWFMIILKVTKNQDFTISHANTYIFEKTTGRIKMDNPSIFTFKLFPSNVKDLQFFKKWLKVFEYLGNKVWPGGILFLQETQW